jgi:hypothetical protein
MEELNYFIATWQEIELLKEMPEVESLNIKLLDFINLNLRPVIGRR